MKKRILACLLALVMLIGILPVTAIAIDEEVPTVPMLDVSKSKTATALDANGQTQITLSLPSAEMKKTLDVVFVVDNAFPTDNNDAADKAAALLDELRGMSQEGNLNINVGLVISGGYKPILHKVDLEDISVTKEKIQDALDKSKTNWKQKEGRKGSNIQAGIETGLAMLEEEDQADKENKYLILISDGGAFSWYDKETGKAWSKVYYQFSKEKAEEEKTFSEDKQSELYYWCNPHDFQQRYKQDSSTEAIGYTRDDFTAQLQKWIRTPFLSRIRAFGIRQSFQRATKKKRPNINMGMHGMRSAAFLQTPALSALIMQSACWKIPITSHPVRPRFTIRQNQLNMQASG